MTFTIDWTTIILAMLGTLGAWGASLYGIVVAIFKIIANKDEKFIDHLQKQNDAAQKQIELFEATINKIMSIMHEDRIDSRNILMANTNALEEHTNISKQMWNEIKFIRESQQKFAELIADNTKAVNGMLFHLERLTDEIRDVKK